MVGTAVDLSSFLWRDDTCRTSTLFPSNHFGQYVLNRQRVVDEVKRQIRRCVNFDPDMAPSVYLLGCRGCDKTSLLTLLGRYFHENGYQVYFFDAASASSRCWRIRSRR